MRYRLDGKKMQTYKIHDKIEKRKWICNTDLRIIEYNRGGDTVATMVSSLGLGLSGPCSSPHGRGVLGQDT